MFSSQHLVITPPLRLSIETAGSIDEVSQLI